MELMNIVAEGGGATGFDMNWIAWILLGLGAGALAKLILPGKQGGGWLMTLILGLVGALLGGFLAALLFPTMATGFWNPITWIVAIVGAILVLLIWGFITKGRSGGSGTVAR